MKAHLIAEIAAAADKLKLTQRSIQRAEKMRGRFRRKSPGVNPIRGILEWQIKALKKALDSTKALL